MQDAADLDCEAFMTMERRLPTRADFVERTTGLRIMRPTTYWGLLDRWATSTCDGVPTPVSDTGAMSRSWDELVEQAQRDVHRIDAPVGGPYFEKEAADVLAALRLWMDLSGRGDGDWLREHLTRDSERLLADARRDLGVSGEEYAAQLLESLQQMREQDRDRVKDVVRIGLSWIT